MLKCRIQTRSFDLSRRLIQRAFFFFFSVAQHHMWVVIFWKSHPPSRKQEEKEGGKKVGTFSFISFQTLHSCQGGHVFSWICFFFFLSSQTFWRRRGFVFCFRLMLARFSLSAALVCFLVIIQTQKLINESKITCLADYGALAVDVWLYVFPLLHKQN